MSNINLAQTMQTLQMGKKISSYTGVIIHAGKDASGNELKYSVGNSTGYVLEIDNPIGTPEMASAILASLKLRGIQYQPFDAGGVELDPSAEIGDGVTVNGEDSTIWTVGVNHSPMMAATVEAPFNEEVQHAFNYEPKAERQFSRESSVLRSRLTITEGQIEAKVSRTGGNESSFGWTLTDSDWSVYSNGSRVLHATVNGLEVTGKITATSGSIGGCNIVGGVLTIASANITSLNADVINTGTLNIGRIADGSITGGVSGKIDAGTITTYNTISGINTNLGYGAAYGAAAVQGSSAPATFFTTNGLAVRSAYLSLNGQACQLLTKTVGGETIKYIGYT